MKKHLIAASTVLTLLTLTACTSGDYDATEVPAKPAPTTTSAAPPAPQPNCGNPVASYRPTAPLPTPGSQMPTGSHMARIQERGRLIAGVSADSLHLGARNPITGVIEGFDIDMVRAVAQAIFGDPNKVELRVISSPQRIPVLRDNSVDIVARNMTINCARWEQIAFSAEYYHSGQKVLVQRDSTAKSLADLSGKTICAPAASTSLDNLRSKYPQVLPITADTDTGCLVLFQQGKAYGITGDDTVLAGEAAQDPYARVIQAPPFTAEPYGLGISLTHPELVRFVNSVLEDMKADGRWKASYDKWLAPTLGKAPAPPQPAYGRS
ncbi:polar amino acid transport system substrate-binding protein [Kribbella sp. VKM Ac-2527]|uniref:Polar amino acid transport system substrate-binding protein n=1 Tax=Kribbella caucasensis TaxID=2512215 RepID=A0A4V3CA74_9ACTN|nr:glutamate ABC transporter substrate-binding protein [Kribbella sp. VKM Ac-2527]TDO49197.1 polar amino acid transport system substrate-binding protein [Kribbella sp. VKM Ac-2527]